MPVETVDGIFIAGFSERGLARLRFPETKARKRRPGATEVPNSWVRTTETAMRKALRGETLRCLPPLDLSCGTEFQRQVWASLRTIPRGETLSYGAVARRIRRPAASRAVGTACGANPVPILVPCHRVLATNGRLGGFSQGLHWKRMLLTAEGAGWVE